jgi:MFS transporter, DHA1 family, multidrug resistance protein
MEAQESKSYISISHSNASEYFCLFLLVLMSSVVHLESHLYSVSFPEMLSYFNVDKSEIESLMRYNFYGICIGGFLVGPLSDSFGRRKILMIALVTYVLTSLGCAMSDNFNLVLILRVITGVAEAAQLILVYTILFDLYSNNKSVKFISFLHGAVGLITVIAPIFGAWIVESFSWKVNLYIVLALSMISCVGVYKNLAETNKVENRTSFNVFGTLLRYGKLITNVRFVTYALVYKLVHIIMLLCAANLSVIFIMNLGIPEEVYGFYAASIPATFIIFSLIAVKVIAMKGAEYTGKLGYFGALIAIAVLLVVAKYDEPHENLTMSVILIMIAGGAFMNYFMVKASSVFSDMKGASVAMISGLEYFMVAAITNVSQRLFDGTIVPFAALIFALGALTLVLYVISTLQEKKQQSS